jgi:hypothetical protein
MFLDESMNYINRAMTNNLIIREWLNGSLFPLSFCLTAIILVFLNDCWHESGKDITAWRKLPGVATGCALFWIFLSETVRGGCVWLLLRYLNEGQPIPETVVKVTNCAFVLALVVMIPTMLKSIHIWTPRRWGHILWIASAFYTVLFLVLSRTFPLH